ncbi:MOSC domain protein [hydrothermal vent metagenome]|uniref:MOSC domain protein n=1 Tax=hydrothermal vent metagenome TaxID=652676 RepID=A0A1W1C336_9ZZZZ
MTNGKVLALYMTMPDMMKLGHRMSCEDFECDPDGILGDMNYEAFENPMLLLTCKKSYELVEEAELALDVGVLMESILVDVNLYHLKAGSVIELGETIFEVLGACEAYGYLMALAPELPEILQGNRGIFVRAIDQGVVSLGDEVKILKEVI